MITKILIGGIIVLIISIFFVWAMNEINKPYFDKEWGVWYY